MPQLRERCIPVEGSSLILIGMPGSGKSTLGRLIARKNGWAWVDTDHLLECWWGMPLQAIRDHLGLEDFLLAEEKLVVSLKLYRTVISTGGSVVYMERAMDHLGAMGKIVYLKAGLETIRHRLGDTSTRGLAMNEDDTLDDIYSQRKPLYERYADFIIETDDDDPQHSVDSIIVWLQR